MKCFSITLAYSMAFLGMSIRGNAYIAPCNSLHFMPFIELNRLDTSLAFSLRLFNTDSFSYLI